MKRILLPFILLCFIALTTVAQTNPIRVACIGNSITEGAVASDRVNKGYVGVLRDLMKPAYDVRNFGVSGATACRGTYKPYDKCELYEQAKAFQPQIVTIALGTNDSQPRVWNEGDFAKNFKADLIYLCETFEALESKPAIYLCLPIPIMPNENWSHQPAVLSDEIIPLIREVAEIKGYPIIDLHTPLLSMPECYPDSDKLHPNDAGHRVIAEIIYEAMPK